MPGKGIALLDEIREISQFAKLHYQVYVGGRLLTVDEGDNVWMMQGLENMDFRVKVLLELFVELVQVNRLDGHVARLLLLRPSLLAGRLLIEEGSIPLYRHANRRTEG